MASLMLVLISMTLISSGVGPLSELVKLSHFLNELNLSRNQIASRGADSFALGLKFNRAIQTLDLSHNNLQDGGCRIIFEAFRDNRVTSIETIHISHNNLGSRAATAAADLISVTMSLKELNMKNNLITDSEGLANFCKALPRARTITHLVIQNQILHNELEFERK